MYPFTVESHVPHLPRERLGVLQQLGVTPAGRRDLRRVTGGTTERLDHSRRDHLRWDHLRRDNKRRAEWFGDYGDRLRQVKRLIQTVKMDCAGSVVIAKISLV